MLFFVERRFRAYPSQNSLRDRTNLLGETYGTPPASGRSTPFQTHGDDHAPSGHRFADDLEGQNDERLEGLTAKVKLLKDVSRFCYCCWPCFYVWAVDCKSRVSFVDIYWDWERSEELGSGSRHLGVLPLSLTVPLIQPSLNLLFSW